VFTSLEDIDQKLEWFNQSSLKYTGYNSAEKRQINTSSDFCPEVIFIRQVGEDNESGYIDVLHEKLPLNQEYINYFVLARWSLQEQKLRIYFEKNQESILIDEFRFLINQNSLST